LGIIAAMVTAKKIKMPLEEAIRDRSGMFR
jgi:hypothetical protein